MGKRKIKIDTNAPSRAISDIRKSITEGNKKRRAEKVARDAVRDAERRVLRDVRLKAAREERSAKLSERRAARKARKDAPVAAHTAEQALAPEDIKCIITIGDSMTYCTLAEADWTLGAKEAHIIIMCAFKDVSIEGWTALQGRNILTVEFENVD